MTEKPWRNPLRRPGCVIGIILWFLLLLSPCLCIMLASRGEVTIDTGSAPEQQLRVWMIQEARQRGLGISNGRVVLQDDNNVCVRTDVSFLLWEGEAESISFCECYSQTDGAWQRSNASENVCDSP